MMVAALKIIKNVKNTGIESQEPKIIQKCVTQICIKHIKPTSGAFIKKHHLTSASVVQRSLSALQEKDIITSSDGNYYIYDYFLYYWLNNL